jgi:hypothetical protein
MPKRVVELKFKGNRLVGGPRRRWFSQFREDEEGEELVRHSTGKDWRLFVHDSP